MKKNIRIEKKKERPKFKIKLNIKFDIRKLLTIFGVVLIISISAIFIVSTIFSFSKRRDEYMKKKIYPQIKIEIYNASGYDGLARKLNWYLRDNGFDVVYYGNAIDTILKTIIVDRIDSSLRYAKILREFLGGGIVKYEPDPDKLTTITILIGKDFYKILPKIKNYDKIF
ncbi:MAG: LytR C-terminal domain-containing protein [candidate division WOR-3 bacterium]|nr:LytR C-terminal domain-containing protein [candidate division WOR-3 bacterium]MCX7947530.1 LytR C-terminal domain-containing protein [candidate division WOR-3 bacterium]MDW8150416.1 LytR C-terminal domain-containing protein [candidate division WOR-3 bacterium]